MIYAYGNRYANLPLYIVQEYTASTTWTKPEGLKEILVVCLSAGGGGGAGRRLASGNNVGGTGGLGGGLAMMRIAASDLTGSSYSVTIGAGGTGGAGTASIGNNGSNGGNTSFGSLVFAPGGLFGSAAVAGTSTLGGISNQSIGSFIPGMGPHSLRGAANNDNVTNSVGIGVSALNGINAGASGGAGGSITTGFVVGPGGRGGHVLFDGSGVSGGTAGTVGGGAGGDGVAVKANLSLLFSYTPLYGIGSGGGGGGASDVSNGGNGGRGARGAGGGGGGSCLSSGGSLGGNGGDGGDGYCMIVEFY